MRILFLFLGLAFATPLWAQASSEELYLARCGGCHGVTARGDGPMAGLLTVPVADLTRLAARNGGVFPLAEVARTIDGRLALRGHGGPMPVFGPILGGGSAALETPDGELVQTRGDVVAIARYLLSLQSE